MPRILISYRRADSAAYAGRLVDRLREHFGTEHVFIDIDTIKPGQDFTEAIARSIARCDAVVAVVGPRWLTETDATGKRRLDGADDLVHMEIATALARGIHVIPVLVGDAAMPQGGDLPSDLSKLARLHALEISDARFHHDVQRLIDALAGSAASVEHRASSEPGHASRSRVVGRLQWGLGALALVLVAWAVSRQLPGVDRVPPTSETARAEMPAGSESGRVSRGERSSASAISLAGNEGVEVVRGAAPSVRRLNDLGTLDRPQQIDLGVTYTFMLEDVETAYLSVKEPAGALLAVMDMHTAASRSTNLQSTLSILDPNGAVVDDEAMVFNEIDWGYRKVSSIALKPQDAPVGLKLLNGGEPNTYWVTVFDTSRVPFVPFFGRVTPRQLPVGKSVSDVLDEGEEVYYTVALQEGTYRAIVDFASTPRARTNIQGYLAILNAAGGNQAQVLRFNEIDVEYRKIGNVRTRSGGTAILRLQTAKPVKYTLRILPADDPTDAPPN